MLRVAVALLVGLLIPNGVSPLSVGTARAQTAGGALTATNALLDLGQGVTLRPSRNCGNVVYYAPPVNCVPSPGFPSGSGSPDVALSKVARGPTPWQPGSYQWFEFKATNVGTAATRGPLTLSDDLPRGVSLTDLAQYYGNGGWSCERLASAELPDRRFRCSYPYSLPPGRETSKLEVRVRVDPVDPPVEVLNLATIDTPGDTNIDNNAANSGLVPVARPRLAIAKEHINSPFELGDANYYAIDATNVGQAPTRGEIVVTDPLPPGVRLVSYTQQTGGSWRCSETSPAGTDLGEVRCRSSQVLAPGQSSQIRFRVRVGDGAPASIVNTAVVSGGGGRASAEARDVVENAGPDVAILKEKRGESFAVGAQGRWDITVINRGRGATRGPIVVRDSLPRGTRYLTYEQRAGDRWTCTGTGDDAGLVECRHPGPLAAGQQTRVTLVVNVGPEAQGLIQNSASVETGGDLDPSNNTTRAPSTVLVEGPDLATSISADTPLTVGLRSTNRVDVENVGRGRATAPTTVSVDLPEGISFELLANGGEDGWTCSGDRFVECRNPGSIAAGGRLPQLVLLVRIGLPAGRASPVTTSADAANAGDRNSANNLATVRHEVRVANLRITKTHNTERPPGDRDFAVGSEDTYKIVVQNTGSGPAFGPIRIADELPAGMEPLNAEGDGWDCTRIGGDRDFGGRVDCSYKPEADPNTRTLGAGETAPEVTILVSPSEGVCPDGAPVADVVNTATVAGSTLPELDLADNTASDSGRVLCMPNLFLDVTQDTPFEVGREGDFTLRVGSDSAAAPPYPYSFAPPERREFRTFQVDTRLPRGWTVVSRRPENVWDECRIRVAVDETWVSCVYTGQAFVRPLTRGQFLPDMRLTVRVERPPEPCLQNPALEKVDYDIGFAVQPTEARERNRADNIRIVRTTVRCPPVRGGAGAAPVQPGDALAANPLGTEDPTEPDEVVGATPRATDDGAEPADGSGTDALQASGGY